MQAHQLRVAEEKEQLDEKIGKLKLLVTSAEFDIVVPHPDERARMERQLKIMGQYSEVLGERIGAFKDDPCLDVGRRRSSIDPI